MHAKTSVLASPDYVADRIWLNGVEESATSGRLASCLASVREAAEAQGDTAVPASWKIHICSENNFPTAAGLASSAAGYACLVFALSRNAIRTFSKRTDSKRFFNLKARPLTI